MSVANSCDIGSVRIAKQYVTIDGALYEKPEVCKELVNDQNYYFIGATGRVHQSKYYVASIVELSRLRVHNAYLTEHDADLAAEIIKATFAYIAKQS